MMVGENLRKTLAFLYIVYLYFTLLMEICCSILILAECFNQMKLQLFK